MTSASIPLRRLSDISDSDIPLDFHRTEETPPGAIGPGPDRHTFHELFLITAGEGTHIVDFVEYPIRPNTLFFVGRGQVHDWAVETVPEGFVILFEDELFPFFGNDQFMAQLDLLRSFHDAARYLSRSDAEWFREAMVNLESEFNGRAFGRQAYLASQVQMMLIRAQRIFSADQETADRATADQHLTQRFLALVEQTFAENPSVSDLAETIGVTAAHMTTVVRKETGVTAGRILRQRRILEAKRLLVHTQMTVAEVASALGFADASYFGRSFKREVDDLTPRRFRQQFERKYQNA